MSPARKPEDRWPETIGFRFTPEDRKLLAALKQKLGVQSMSDIIRQGIRVLAEKEGVPSV